MATDSIRGALLQLVCIGVGVAIYYPFIRMNKTMQEISAKEKIKLLVTELQEKEQENEKPKFITRADSLGLISRMLIEDLKIAIEQDNLYLMYQPQVDISGRCIGGEALLRWNHPSYGMIFPPLIIYLAKEGEILQQLEEKLFDMAAASIKRTGEEYDGEFKISVNITAKSLLWDVESCIDASLEKYNIPANRMWIEITEQDVISNADSVLDKLRRLDDKGHTLLNDLGCHWYQGYLYSKPILIDEFIEFIRNYNS